MLAQSIINADSTETQDVIGAMELLVEDYRGVSGVCTFDDDGDRMHINYDIFGYHWVDYVPQYSIHGIYDYESDSFIWENIPDGEPPDIATLEFGKDLRISSEDDHLSSGDHLANVYIENRVENNDDLTNDELGGLEFFIRAEDIIDVEEGDYATWDSTYAHWVYPPEYTVPEDESEIVRAYLDHQEVARSLWSIDRWVDQEEFTSNGYQETVFTVTFAEIDETSCHIITDSDENVKTEFILESFWTDAPIEFLSIFENLIDFDFNPDEIVIGQEYTFNVTTQITILQDFVTWVQAKPTIRIGYNYNEEQIVVESLQHEVVAPDNMLPGLVSEIRASTNVSNVWRIRRRDSTSAVLEGVLEYSYPQATLEFGKQLTIWIDSGDHLSSGDHLANVNIKNAVSNDDDLLNDELGGLELFIWAEDIIDVEESEYATWNSTYAHWTYPPEHTLSEGEYTHVGANLDHQEVARSLWSIDRWVDQEEFTSNGYQEAVFTVTFEETYETACSIYTESDENVKTEFMLDSFWTDAPIELKSMSEDEIGFMFITDEIVIGHEYTFNVTTQITIQQDFVTWVRTKPQIGVWYDYNEERIIVESLQHDVVAPDYMLPGLVSEIRASTNVPNVWTIERCDNTDAYLNNVFEYSDP